MAEQLSLIEGGAPPRAARLSMAHQVVINGMAALLVPPMLDPELRPLFLAEVHDALMAVRGVDAPGPVTQVMDAAWRLVTAAEARATTQTAEAWLEALHAAEFHGRKALGTFFYWRLAGASDALKNGAGNAPA